MLRRLEKFYYEPVRRFLRTKMDCTVESVRQNGSTRPFVSKGVGGLIVDVYGLRGFPGLASRSLEGIAVEVKRSKRRTSLRSLVQAAQYGRLAHRCYLAQPRKFDAKTQVEASRFGVGLIQMNTRGMKIVAESRLFQPDPETFEAFLYRLDIVKCAICACHLFRYMRSTGDIHVNGHWVTDEFSSYSGRRQSNKKMYLCQKCRLVLSGVTDERGLRKSIEKLSRRLQRLERKQVES